jgi:hypothetical protein
MNLKLMRGSHLLPADFDAAGVVLVDGAMKVRNDRLYLVPTDASPANPGGVVYMFRESVFNAPFE